VARDRPLGLRVPLDVQRVALATDGGDGAAEDETDRDDDAEGGGSPRLR
jgi:hypothetical protein